MLRACAYEAHAARRPLFRHVDRASLNAGRHTMLVTLLDELFHGRNELGILKISRYAEGDREIRGTYHRNIDAGELEQFLGAVKRRDGFELDDRNRVAIHVFHNLSHGLNFISDHGRINAIAALANGRIAQPA